MRCIAPSGFSTSRSAASSLARIREMMKNPGTDDLIEVRPEFACTLDRQLAHLEIAQRVFALKILGTAYARRA